MLANISPTMCTPPTINKYKNGKIYKITSAHTGAVYVGSTIKSLSKRFSQHRQAKDTSCLLIMKHADARIDLIEAYPSNDRYALEAREAYWMKQLPNTVNKATPTGLPPGLERNRAYRQRYRDQRNALCRAYYQRNRDRIRARRRLHNQRKREQALLRTVIRVV